jgi:hypothetical protein
MPMTSTDWDGAIPMCERKRVLPRWIFAAAFAAMAGVSTARADVGILVPSYFYPTGGGVGDSWGTMIASAGQVHITAILNPNSGPGNSADPNYTSAMTLLENAGGSVVAYVYTNNGNAPLATVEGEINTYISQYGGLIKGFFLDGMFLANTIINGNPVDTLPYYDSLYGYIKGLSQSYTVIGNPGQPFLNGVTPQQYLSTADVFNIFEGTNAGFSSYPYGLNWFQTYSSNRFDNTIFDVPTASAMVADLGKAVGLNAGYVYITDQTLPNPYSQLPSYWDQEVAAVASIPEPSSLTIVLTTGGLLGMARFARRRLARAS